MNELEQNAEEYYQEIKLYEKPKKMKRSLYNIKEDYHQLMHSIEQAEGELTDELAGQLEINEQEREDKSLAYICVIADKESFIATLDEEIKRLSALKKREQNTIQRLKDNLLDAVRLFGDYAAGMFTVSTRKSTSVSIEDEGSIPAMYWIEKVTESVDKKMIKEAIKSGATVEGAAVITNLNLNIK